MTIAFRSGTYTTSTGSCSATLPAGVQNGDLLIALIATDSTAPMGTGGFTQQASVGANQAYVGTKIASNEGGTENFGAGGGGTYCTVTLLAYSGVNPATPMDATATAASGTVTNVAFPSITTVTNNAWHYAAHIATGTTDATAPSGYSTDWNEHPTSEFHVYHKNKTPAGLISGITTTGGGLPAWSAFSLALQPAAPQLGSQIFLMP
jgi:hypothetical protein